MNPDQILDEVILLAHRELNISQLPAPEAPLDEHLDSMQRLGLVVAIEDHFQVAFEPEDDEEAKTLEDVVRILSHRLSLSSDE